MTEITAANYVENVLRTESMDMDLIQGRLDTDTVALLRNTLSMFANTTEKLDMLKKYVFYGRQSDFLRSSLSKAQIPVPGQRERMHIEQTIRLMHAVLGIATEAGELVEMMLDHLDEGKPIDEVNAAEEVGDCFWYQGVACDVLGTTIEQVMQTNIDKLRRRYPAKFDEDAAINRDHAAERAILEGTAPAIEYRAPVLTAVREYKDCSCGGYGTFRETSDGPLLCMDCRQPLKRIEQ